MLMKRSLRELTRTFVAGLLAALPLFATAAVFIWLGRLLYDWLGPNSLVGQVFVQLGIGLSGSALLGYALGALIIVLGVFALGLLVEAELQRGLARLVNGVVRRIPLVRNVYDLISRFVDMLSQREDDGLKSMSPVWCSFGGEGGVKVLGLLSTPDPIVLDGQRYRAVLVPTANMRAFDEVPTLLVPARACENRVFVAYANACGRESDTEYGGLSTLAGPLGTVLAQAGRDTALTVVRLSAQALDEARASSPLPQRRTDLY